MDRLDRICTSNGILYVGNLYRAARFIIHGANLTVKSSQEFENVINYVHDKLLDILEKYSVHIQDMGDVERYVCEYVNEYGDDPNFLINLPSGRYFVTNTSDYIIMYENNRIGIECIRR